MRKIYKLGLTLGIISLMTAGAAMAQSTYNRKDSTSVVGSFLQNIPAQKMIFGAIDAADNGKDQDLLIFKLPSGIELYKNGGTGSYTLNPSTFDVLTSPNGAWSKVDGNIVITGLDGTSAKTTILYKRDGSGGYVKVSNPIGGTAEFPGITGFVGFIDYNKDGKDDVFLVDNATGTSYLYQNLGSDQYALVTNPVDGTANFPVMILNSYQVTGVVIGDYNKDGYQDIAVAARVGTGASDTYTSIYKNNGNGTFSKITITLDGTPTTNFPGVAYGSIDFGDLDADGYATDLAVVGNTSGNSSTNARVVKVFKQDATDPNVYTTVLSYGNGSGGKRYGQVLFADLTGSGFKKDLITTGQLASGSVSTDVIITNASSASSPSFTEYAKTAEGNAPYTVNTTDFASFIWDATSNNNYRFFALGDINGNGKKNDIAKFGASSNMAALYTYNAFNPIILTTANNTYFAVGEGALLKANILSAVPSNPVQKVEFYANNVKIGETATAPYEYAAIGLAQGAHTITTKVIYQDATNFVSKPITINVRYVVHAPVAADTYANGLNATTKAQTFGDAANLVVKRDAAYRETYIRFNLADFSGTSTDKAILRLYEIGTNTGVNSSKTWDLYLVKEKKDNNDDNDIWDENTLTYNNSFGLIETTTADGSPIQKATQVQLSGGAPVAIEWDITSLVNTELVGDKTFSLIIRGSGSNGSTNDASFASKENTDATLRPVLKLYTPQLETLPVNFISFSSKTTTQGVQLTWKVASETNHKQYIVSRSTDGVNFSVIGTTTAHSYLDNTVSSGTYYYQLAQEDNDGKSSKLATSVVKIGLTANTMVFPNPSKGKITVNVDAGAYQTYTLSGLQGNTIASGTIAKEATAINIDLTKAAKGTYIIRLSGANGNSTSKVVKL